MSPESQFRLLVAAARADGQVGPEEQAVLRKYARRLGIAAAVVRAIVAEAVAGGDLERLEAAAGGGEGDPGGRESVRRACFERLVEVSAADALVAPQEAAFLQRVGANLGLEANQVEGYIRGAMAGARGRRGAERPPRESRKHDRREPEQGGSGTMGLKDQFRLLAAAACIDGRIQTEERTFLLDYARSLGVARTAAEAVLGDVAKGGRVEVVGSLDPDESRKTFEKLVGMVAADHKITQAEADFLKRVGPSFGVKAAEVQGYIAGTIAEIKEKRRKGGA